MFAWRWGVVIIQAGLLITALLALVWNWQLTDLSDDWSARHQGEKILNMAKPNAVIFGWWDTVAVIEYLQMVEGQRPDVVAINRFLISPANMEQFIQRQVGRRPVYMDAPPGSLLRRYDAVQASPIFQLVPEKPRGD